MTMINEIKTVYNQECSLCGNSAAKLIKYQGSDSSKDCRPADDLHINLCKYCLGDLLAIIIEAE